MPKKSNSTHILGRRVHPVVGCNDLAEGLLQIVDHLHRHLFRGLNGRFVLGLGVSFVRTYVSNELCFNCTLNKEIVLERWY